MSAAERSGFDLHGLPLPAGGAEALAVPKPVLGGGGQKHLAGQRHGGVQRTVAAAFDRPGQAADLAPHERTEGGVENGFAAADHQHRSERIAVPLAEKPQHADGDLVLLILQKAAVYQHRQGRPVVERMFLQIFQKVQQADRVGRDTNIAHDYRLELPVVSVLE